jgi:hypothetical protein
MPNQQQPNQQQPRNAALAADVERWGEPEIAEQIRRGEGNAARLAQEAHRRGVARQSAEWAASA